MTEGFEHLPMIGASLPMARIATALSVQYHRLTHRSTYHER